MNLRESDYLKMPRVLGYWIAIWPYQKTPFLPLIRFVFIVILTSGIVVQLLSFLTTEYSLDLLLKVLSYTIIKMIYMLKYVTALITSDKVKKCMEEIESHWDSATSDKERDILIEYAEKGKLRVIYFALFLYPTLFTFLLNPIVPDVLDLIVPLNESRERQIPVISEYFVDQQTYFYPILFHIYVVDMVGITAMVASEGPMIMFVSHLCGMFVITRERIDNVLEKKTVDVTTDKKASDIYEAIIHAIAAHNKSLEFTEYLKTNLITSYFFLMNLGVASLSVNLFRLSQAISRKDEMEELVISIAVVITHFGCVFIANVVGQEVIDHSDEIFSKVCDLQWYMSPVPAQKLLMFIMLRSAKCSCFVPGGIFVASYEGFSKLVSTALSYFTVMLSTGE